MSHGAREARREQRASEQVDLEELSDDSLADYAGEAVFERGLAYYDQGRCTLVRDGGSGTTWRVRGTASYQVELYFEDPGLHVNCTCPHAAEGSFCKHIVAAALAWRELLQGEAASEAKPAARSAGKAGKPSKPSAADRRDALWRFVQERPPQELARRIWAWAEHDRELMADLKAWRAQAEAATRPGAWKESLSELLRKTRDFYDWHESAQYAERAAKALPLLHTLAGADPATALEACAAAMRKLFKVCEHSDDSGGHLGGVLHAVHDVVLQALRTASLRGKDAARWLDTWLALQDQDPWGLWDDEAMLAAAGADVAERYSARVAEDWSRWLQKRAAAGSTSRPAAFWSSQGSFDLVRHRLRTRYLDDLKRRGDTQALVEALRSDLSCAHDHLQLAEALEAHGRQREALQQLEAANKMYSGDWRLQEALLRAYERDGCTEEVLVIRREQLERNPDVERYVAVLAAAKAAGRDLTAYRAELYAWAEQSEPRGSIHSWGRDRDRDSATRNATVRVQWFAHERRYEEALALAQKPATVVNEGVLLGLARSLPKSHAAQAAAIFERAFRARMQRAQSPYRDALDLVREMLAAMSRAQAREKLVWLRAEYRAKRNFIAGLASMDAG